MAEARRRAPSDAGPELGKRSRGRQRYDGVASTHPRPGLVHRATCTSNTEYHLGCLASGRTPAFRGAWTSRRTIQSTMIEASTRTYYDIATTDLVPFFPGEVTVFLTRLYR